MTTDEQLITLLETIQETGSISRSAAQLYLTQPTVSKLLKKYERQLGVTLVDRHHHPVTLTIAGQYYLQGIRDLNNRRQHILAHLKTIATATPSTLTLGINPSLAGVVLPQIIPEFSRRHPATTIQLIEQSPATLLRLLTANKIDAYIGINPPHHQRITMNPLFRDTMALVLPSSWKVTAAGAIPDIAPLISDHPFICEKETSTFNHLVTSYLERYEIHPHTVLTADNIVTALQLARAGLGATIVPHSPLAAQNTPVRAFSIPASSMQFTTALCISSDHQHSPTLTSFQQFIVQKYR